MPVDKMTTLAGSSSPEPHSDICKCPMCMKSHISDSLALKNQHSLQATMVDRRNPEDPVRPLMKATVAHAIIKAGSRVDMMAATGLSYADLPDTSEITIHTTQPKELRLKAKWKKGSEEAAVTGRDASVFGALGVLLVPPDFSVLDIPKMDALAVPASFLKKYGAELIPLDQPFELDAVQHKELEQLYLVQYDFDKDYIDQYVMNMKGGGGLFVETHPFPHVFTPLAKNCGGALILGVPQGKGEYDFAAFIIPYGYTMKIASNVIHGDSFFVGPYAIALTDTELADSVIFRQETPARGIEKVTETQTVTILLPLLAEYGLAKAVNHFMLIEKIRHEGAKGKDLAFFQRLPTDILVAVQDISKAAYHALNERPEYIQWKTTVNAREKATISEIVDDTNTAAPKATEPVTHTKQHKQKLSDLKKPEPDGTEATKAPTQ